MADRSAAAAAEIATLRQKLAAAAALIQEEMGRHEAAGADKATRLNRSWTLRSKPL
jgi:hypothetical protein